MSNKPLSIEVAEAIGWTDIRQLDDGRWFGEYSGISCQIPNYDRSWCSLGPWIDRLRVEIDQDAPGGVSVWAKSQTEQGSTVCEAVARLIVKLKKEGKLPE